MTREQQSKHFNLFTDKMGSVMISKSGDYAKEIDVLSNFKLAGTICGLTAEQNCLSLIATKVARLGVLLSDTGKAPNNESIRDSILDLANYAVLLDMLVGEKEEQKCAEVTVKGSDIYLMKTRNEEVQNSLRPQ